MNKKTFKDKTDRKQDCMVHTLKLDTPAIHELIIPETKQKLTNNREQAMIKEERI